MALNIPQQAAAVQVKKAAQPTQQAFSSSSGLQSLPVFGISSPLSHHGSGGEMFEKLFEKLSAKAKILNEEIKTEERYDVVKVLKQAYGINYSAIAVVETITDSVSVHVLMVEKTGDYPEKVIENISGIRYEITRTPADALSEDRYLKSVQKAVSDTLKVNINNVVIIDATLVPNEFDVTNDNLISDLFNNTYHAIHSENVVKTTDYKGINIPDLLQEYKNGKFFINLYFNGEDTSYFDQTGMPVRQDVCIGLSFKVNQGNNNRAINQGNDTRDIVKTYGYIDFEFIGNAPVNGMMSTQRFIPNFVITHIEASCAPTPDIMMLAVTSVLAINEDMNWMQAFRSTPARKNEIDFNDIGGLNIEGNLENSQTGFGKKYDTKSKTFDVAELNKYIQTLIRPNILISIDVPKAGPDTWFTSMFQYIKFNNNKAAYDRVNNFLVHMTNGIYQSNNLQVFNDTSNKIHGGYYKTKDGVKDIRHLSSYLAISNYIADTNQNPILISQYTNTLYNSNIPSELRAAERKKFIDEMSNKTAVYKQYYDRMTFNSAFLMNLIGSLKNSGFSPVFSNMGAVNEMFVRRSTADFTSAALGLDARVMNSNTNIFGTMYNPQATWYRNF